MHDLDPALLGRVAIFSVIGQKKIKRKKKLNSLIWLQVFATLFCWSCCAAPLASVWRSENVFLFFSCVVVCWSCSVAPLAVVWRSEMCFFSSVVLTKALCLGFRFCLSCCSAPLAIVGCLTKALCLGLLLCLSCCVAPLAVCFEIGNCVSYLLLLISCENGE